MLEDLPLAWSLPLFSSSSSWADPSKFEDLLLVWSFSELSIIIHDLQITKLLLLKNLTKQSETNALWMDSPSTIGSFGTVKKLILLTQY